MRLGEHPEGGSFNAQVAKVLGCFIIHGFHTYAAV